MLKAQEKCGVGRNSCTWPMNPGVQALTFYTLGDSQNVLAYGGGNMVIFE